MGYAIKTLMPIRPIFILIVSLLWIAISVIIFTRFLAITGTTEAISDLATIWVGGGSYQQLYST